MDHKTIGWLLERLKNQDPEQKITLIINGIEHPLTDAYFSSEDYLLVAKPPENCIEVVRPFNMDAEILANGREKLIYSVKKYRELSMCGLRDAKLYVEKILKDGGLL